MTVPAARVHPRRPHTVSGVTPSHSGGGAEGLFAAVLESRIAALVERCQRLTRVRHVLREEHRELVREIAELEKRIREERAG